MYRHKKDPGAGHAGVNRNGLGISASSLKRNLSLALEGREPPVVRCTVKGGSLIIERCPLCGKRHTHGTGGKAGPDFGHRLAHCFVREKGTALDVAVVRGYTLVAS